MSYPGLCQGLVASANPIADACAYGIPVFEVAPNGPRWRVTCSDGHAGGLFFDRSSAFKFAREEAEECESALVCARDPGGRTAELLVVEHPRTP